jgi:hypothetical protein
MMQREEKRQTRVDRFWGQDKDLFDRQVEKLHMQSEEELSKKQAALFKIEALHKKWDRDQENDRNYRNQIEQYHKQTERENYIKLITKSTVSSEDVINTIWGIDANNNHRPPPPPFNPNPQKYNPNFQNMSLDSPGDSSFIHASTLTGPSNGMNPLEFTRSTDRSSQDSPSRHNKHTGGGGIPSGPVHMSIHLDGLQQSKAIIDKASYSFKQTLRR